MHKYQRTFSDVPAQIPSKSLAVKKIVRKCSLSLPVSSPSSLDLASALSVCPPL